MSKKNPMQQPPDIGKLTNIQYGTKQDEQTPEMEQTAKSRHDKK